MVDCSQKIGVFKCFISNFNIQIYRKNQKMNFKYECKRFQRNHQLINSNSHKNLTISFDKDTNQTGSIQSIDDSRGLTNNLPHLNETASVFQRLDQLESAFQFEKKERFHDCNRLMKMIRQMECKHSSIIYESEIKYCKSPTKPQIFFSPNNALLKKVSSSHQTYKNGKQNKGCNEQKCQKNSNNLVSSEKNQEKRVNLQKDFLTPISKYNPQRGEKDEKKQCKKELTEQDLEQKIIKTQQKLNNKVKREVESLRQQIMKEVMKSVDDLMKNITNIHEKDVKISNSKTEKLQKNIEECKQNTMDIFEKVIKQIQNVEYVCQDNNRAEFDNIYAEIEYRTKQIESKTQYSINKVEQILEAFQLQKQVFMKQRESITHIMRDKLNDNKIQRRIQVLQKEIHSNKFDESTIKLLQNYIKESLKEVQLNLKASFASTIKQLSIKSFQMEGRFQNQIDSIRSRIENIVLTYSNQNSKIKNLQLSTQSNFNFSSNKINQILQTLNSELSSVERNKQIFIEFQRLRAKQIQNEKRNDQLKREKQRQYVGKMVDQKISNKVQIFRIVSSKQIQSRYQKVQEQILQVIQRHIKQVENFMNKISHQEERITSKFLGTLQYI